MEIKKELRPIEGINIEDEVKCYRRFLETAKEMQEHAELVFERVKDMELVARFSRDPYLIALQDDPELKRDASLLYAKAETMEHMGWHYELCFEDYEVYVMIKGYEPFLNQ